MFESFQDVEKAIRTIRAEFGIPDDVLVPAWLHIPKVCVQKEALKRIDFLCQTYGLRRDAISVTTGGTGGHVLIGQNSEEWLRESVSPI